MPKRDGAHGISSRSKPLWKFWDRHLRTSLWQYVALRLPSGCSASWPLVSARQCLPHRRHPRADQVPAAFGRRPHPGRSGSAGGFQRQDLELAGHRLRRRCRQNAHAATDQLFWIASMSKAITATALMMLVDEGKVKLDDRVEKYLPDFASVMVSQGQKDHHAQLTPPAHPLPFGTCLRIPAAWSPRACSSAATWTGCNSAKTCRCIRGWHALRARQQVRVLQRGNQHRRANRGTGQRDALREVSARSPVHSLGHERYHVPPQRRASQTPGQDLHGQRRHPRQPRAAAEATALSALGSQSRGVSPPAACSPRPRTSAGSAR